MNINNTKAVSVDRDKIATYAELTQDFNPIHMDPEFAAKTPMKGIIAHGTMSMNLIWEALAAHIDLLNNQVKLDVRFVKPIREGSIVVGGAAPSAVPQAFDVWVNDEAGDAIITGTAVFGAPAQAELDSKVT